MSFERSVPSEAMFERRLLESARNDAQPPDVEGAWTRFAGALGQVAPDPSGGLADAQPATVAAAAASTRVAWGTAMKWLLLGAIGGSGLTAGVLLGRREGAPSPPRLAAESAPARAPLAVVNPPRSSGLVPSHGDDAIAASGSRNGGGSRLRAARPRTETVLEGRHRDEGSAPPAGVPSTLAAEVSRIDTARIASSSGDYDEAIRLIERYHRDFPKGALAPDADVVALEAAAAKRDAAELARWAAQFLARYPGDPHAARVRWLAAHPGR